MKNENRREMIKRIGYSAAIVFPVTLCALFVSTFIFENGLLYKFAPLWLTLTFALICFLIERIPVMHRQKHVVLMLQLICVALAAALLKHFG